VGIVHSQVEHVNDSASEIAYKRSWLEYDVYSGARVMEEVFNSQNENYDDDEESGDDDEEEAMEELTDEEN
jgi:hypothetical protein